MAVHLGFYNTSGTRTFVRVLYSTHSSAGGNVAPSTAIDAADIRIYKAADGAAFSATQRSSASGITSTSPFDTLTGFHEIDIDLADNTDAGFYAAGSLYAVVLAPSDETIDSQTITGVVLAYFEIGVAKADVTQFAGTAITAASGIPEVKAASLANNAITAASINADAITAAKVAADVSQEIRAEIDSNSTQLAAIVADTNELQTDWANGGRLDLLIDSIISKVDAVDDFLDTEIAAILAAVDTEIAAIKAKTDSLTFTVANQVDANMLSINDTTVNGDGAGTPWGP